MTVADPPEPSVQTDGAYRYKLVAIEPGGNEFIALEDRHGNPRQLFRTWTSPNLEFATIFIGVLAVAVYGMTFRQAAVGIVVGAGLGAIAHYVLSARGPVHGVPQMVLGRLAFGFKGNRLPRCSCRSPRVSAGSPPTASAGRRGGDAVTHRRVAGVDPDRGDPDGVRFLRPQPGAGLRTLVLSAAGDRFHIASIVVLSKSHLGAPALPDGVGGLGGFLLTVGTTFGYTAGWTPYAADYTRYLPATLSTPAPDCSRRWGCSCPARCWRSRGGLVTIGPATSDNPTAAFTSELASPLAKATLLAIAVGAIAANCINVYSGAMAFVTIGITLPHPRPSAGDAVLGNARPHRLVGTGLRRRQLRAFRRPSPTGSAPGSSVFADQYLAGVSPSPDLCTTGPIPNAGGLASFVIDLRRSRCCCSATRRGSSVSSPRRRTRTR